MPSIVLYLPYHKTADIIKLMENVKKHKPENQTHIPTDQTCQHLVVQISQKQQEVWGIAQYT